MPKREWLTLLDRFVHQLRIQSKHVATRPGEPGAPLKMWRSQTRALAAVKKGLEDGIRVFLFLKSRQLGMSTITMAVMLFWAAMHPNTIGAIVTDTEGNRESFRELLKAMHASIPAGFLGSKFTIAKENKSFVLFSNGTRIDYLVAGTSARKQAWAESRAYLFVWLTEVSKYGDPMGLQSFRDTLATDTNPEALVIYESTANGFNHWRDMWIDARRSVSMVATFIGWWANDTNVIGKKDKRFPMFGLSEPTREEREKIRLVLEKYGHTVTPEQLAWYRERSLGQAVSRDALDQFQPWTEEDAFIQSGQSFFYPRLVQKHIARVIDPQDPVMYRPYRFHLGADFWSSKMEPLTPDRRNEIELRVWEEPEADAQYVIGADPAFGRNDHKDCHSFNVFRAFGDKLAQVAEYADHKVETRQAAWVLAYLSGAYRNCIVNIELTGGPGKAVRSEYDSLKRQLRSEQYTAVAKAHGWDEDFLDTARAYILRRVDSPGSSGYVIDWNTHAGNKYEIFNQYRDSFLNGSLIINSVPLLEEMTLTQQEGMQVGAPKGSKDDRTFAAVLANRAWIDHLRTPLLSQGYLYETVMGGLDPGPIANKVGQIVKEWFTRAEALADENDNPALPEYLNHRWGT